MTLVANRECGECTVCCKVLLIDDAEFQKLPGILCPNCKVGAGCQIYDTRPRVCRAFHCGWRQLPNLGDDWRPDRSGILIRWQSEGIPPGFHSVGVNFVVFGQKDAIFRPGFAEYLGTLIDHRVPTFLSMRGPDGFSDGTIFLNEYIAAAVAARDRDQVMKILSDALEALSKNEFDPVVLKHGNAN